MMFSYVQKKFKRFNVIIETEKNLHDFKSKLKFE